MTKAEKLRAKLKARKINARELRTLLKQEGAIMDRTVGSHEHWVMNGKVLTLATHSKDLKVYQIKEAIEFLKK